MGPKLKSFFMWFATKASQFAGSPWAFTFSFMMVLVWALSGPLFGWSEGWQLIINTSTTIITFLIVFLVQYTQNRQAIAMDAKLNEIIRAITSARNEVRETDKLSDEELQKLHEETKVKT